MRTSIFGLVLVLVGCGDDGEDGTTTAGGTETAGGAETAEATGDVATDTGTGAGVEPCVEPTLALDLCDPATATFTLDSTNSWFPLNVGDAAVLEGMDGSEMIRIERTVLPDTEMVAGVETHVLEHREYVDGELVEVALDYLVESSAGVVCYFGEDVDNYEDGMLADHDGTWRAGEDGASPGILMPADPQPGDAYYQEYAPGQALDMGQVESVGTTEMVGESSYDDVVTVLDTNPLEGCEDAEPKRYAPGIGEIADVDVVLVEFTAGG